jgi:hypothetical protein
VTNRPERDDAGGVWIRTGWVLGILLYAFIVLMAVAGFSPVIPLVVIPPVLAALIAGNSLLGGGRGRGSGRPARPVGPPPAPVSDPGVTLPTNGHVPEGPLPPG